MDLGDGKEESWLRSRATIFGWSPSLGCDQTVALHISHHVNGSKAASGVILSGALAFVAEVSCIVLVGHGNPYIEGPVAMALGREGSHGTACWVMSLQPTSSCQIWAVAPEVTSVSKSLSHMEVSWVKDPHS